jgi:hypothetical protein
MQQVQLIKEILDKWKVNRNLLSSKMGISKGAFNNKLSGRHPYKFTSEEMKQLKIIIKEFLNDLKKIK